MYQYLPPEKLDELAAHDDPDVRHLAEDVRQYAGELLLKRFREYGQRFFQDPNAPELPRLLWQAVQEGPEELSEEEVAELEHLARTANGWWRPGDRQAMQLVDLQTWIADYAEATHVRA